MRAAIAPGELPPNPQSFRGRYSRCRTGGSHDTRTGSANCWREGVKVTADKPTDEASAVSIAEDLIRVSLDCPMNKDFGR